MSTDPRDGFDLVIMDKVDSTMAEAARIAAHIKRPTWIMAHEQTSGRGRSGRRWENPRGNFTATLVYRPEATAQEAAQRSFMAANALYQTLALHVDPSKLSLKWPNDVLLAGGKVAGILLEASGGAHVDWLAIGVGVNLIQAPKVPDAAFAPVALSQFVQPPNPEDFLRDLASAFATQESKLAALGFARIRRDWLAQAARLGEVITARTSRDTHEGTFRDVDEEGNLVLETPKGTLTIAAADVYF